MKTSPFPCNKYTGQTGFISVSFTFREEVHFKTVIFSGDPKSKQTAFSPKQEENVIFDSVFKNELWQFVPRAIACSGV